MQKGRNPLRDQQSSKSVYLDVSNEPGDYEDTTFSALIKMLGLETWTHLKIRDYIFQAASIFQ